MPDSVFTCTAFILKPQPHPGRLIASALIAHAIRNDIGLGQVSNITQPRRMTMHVKYTISCISIFLGIFSHKKSYILQPLTIKLNLYLTL